MIEEGKPTESNCECKETKNKCEFESSKKCDC